MKKTDTIIAFILGIAILVVCVLAWLGPMSEGAGHVHSESCGHDHSHGGAGHVHSESCGHDHSHGGSHSEESAHGHANHEHSEHESHEMTEIALSLNALKNIGLDSPDSLFELQPGNYSKTHRIPAVIQEFEGRTMSKVPAPYAGVVTKIYHEPGEAVHPGAALFDLTLSLPEMMEAQIAFLKLIETKEFLEREIAEIDKNLSGLAPQRRRELDIRLKETLIDITNQKNAVRVLGLPEEVLVQIERERRPITHVMTVCVPAVSHEGIVSEHNPGEVKVFVVFETLYVRVGQSVSVGETLCDLCDLCELTVRGEAFAINEGILLEALQNPETPVRVTFDGTGKAPLENLRLRMVESRVDEEARTLSCFADFKNTVLGGKEPDPHTEPHPPRYVHWLHKPGQRCQMEITYGMLENVFVVPAGAVAHNVQETFIFELTEETSCGEKIWRQRPVHLLLRTRENAILANDGSFPSGIRIAAKSASFIQEAVNAQSGSGTKIDPHAGHNH